MHHPNSISATRRLRLASLLLLINRLLILSAGGMLLVSVFASDGQLMLFGSILVITSFLLILAQWIAASHSGCPLCRTPVLAPMKCARHRRAKRLMGSYRLRVALSILLKERFRCPYCNEPTAMAVGERIRGSLRRGTGIAGVSKNRPPWT